MYIVPHSPPLGRGIFFQVIWEGFPVVEVQKEENRKERENMEEKRKRSKKEGIKRDKKVKKGRKRNEW